MVTDLLFTCFTVEEKDYTQMQSEFEKNKNKEKLENEILSDAGAIVPLLGNERSPEMLTEIAGALIKNKKVQTIHVTEVPDQTYIDDDFLKKIQELNQ